MSSSVLVSTPTAPARSAIRASSSGSKVCRSTTASSAAARDDSSRASLSLAHFSRSGGSWVTALVAFQVRLAEPAGVPVAHLGGLAGDDEPAAGLEHPQDLAERRLDIGDVVDHGVADDDVEGVVVIGNSLGVGDPALRR